VDLSKLPDWRIAVATEVAEDTRLPSGHLAKKGDLVLVVTMTRDDTHAIVTFPTPGPAALAIDVSIHAAKQAATCRKAVEWRVLPEGQKYLEDGKLPVLFDYFEQSMIAVTFAYQALEAFSNVIIANSPTKEHELERRDGIKTVSSEELERLVSTEEKLSTVLPRLCSVSSPKGKAIWADFKKLKAMRDSTVHLKSYDQYRRGDIDRASLYHRFLNADAREAPRLSIQIMQYFSNANGQGWLGIAQGKLKAPDA
jgi:hypothetical protein